MKMLVNILGVMLAWILTLVYWMVFMPIVWVVQGLIVPFEVIYICIKDKRLINPLEYWLAVSRNITNAFAILEDTVVNALYEVDQLRDELDDD